MRKNILVLVLISCFLSSSAQDTSQWFNHITPSFSKGFKVYGLNDEHYQLKDENFTSVISLDIHIYKNHGVYGEYINQPLMKIRRKDLPVDLDLFYYSFYYDAYIRSYSYCVGYKYTKTLLSNLEASVFAGLGQTYVELREYFTDQETLDVSSFDTKDTLGLVSVGLDLQYFLPNNLGFRAQAACAANSPVFKLGVSYKLESP